MPLGSYFVVAVTVMSKLQQRPLRTSSLANCLLLEFFF